MNVYIIVVEYDDGTKGVEQHGMSRDQIIPSKEVAEKLLERTQALIAAGGWGHLCGATKAYLKEIEL